MYIRWKYEYKLPTGGFATRATDMLVFFGPLWRLYLVESKRVNGKPRQKTRYIGSMRGHSFQNAEARADFWKRIDVKLDTFGLDPQTRERIERQIAVELPRPEGAEQAQAKRELSRVKEKFNEACRAYERGGL
jgi:hypothetical protein